MNQKTLTSKINKNKNVIVAACVVIVVLFAAGAFSLSTVNPSIPVNSNIYVLTTSQAVPDYYGNVGNGGGLVLSPEFPATFFASDNSHFFVEVRGASGAKMAGVTVSVYDSDSGTLFGSIVTDVNGQVLFDVTTTSPIGTIETSPEASDGGILPLPTLPVEMLENGFSPIIMVALLVVALAVAMLLYKRRSRRSSEKS